MYETRIAGQPRIVGPLIEVVSAHLNLFSQTVRSWPSI